MTNFNPDPRVRDKEPDDTELGPNFPGSLGDLERMSYRPSDRYLRYVLIAVGNDDGSPITSKTNALLTELLSVMKDSLAELRALRELSGAEGP